MCENSSGSDLKLMMANCCDNGSDDSDRVHDTDNNEHIERGNSSIYIYIYIYIFKVSGRSYNPFVLEVIQSTL